MQASGYCSDYVMVCAIDFGTTFSGYAFSFKSAPEDIKMNKNWGNSLGFQSYKTPTSVLVDSDRDFKAFGFEAEEQYGQAVEVQGETNLSLYRHFKMILHKKGNVTRNSTVCSLNGTLIPAMQVFTYALEYLKDHMLEAVAKSTTTDPKASMIRWVITVPAIWSDESKQFMREAAFKAGIIPTQDSRQLVIALEPEAASLFCRRVDINHFVGEESNLSIKFNSGTKYLVIDAGGGTVDITAHQILPSGDVKELHAATGGAWGGTKVDENFVELLVKVLGTNFINRYKSECPQQWLVLMTNFEKVKKAIKPDGKSTMNISLSWSMGSKYSEITGGLNIERVIKKNGGQYGVEFVNGSLMINNKAVRAMFDPVTKEIVKHIEDLLSMQKLHPCQYFFLVGGFSESEFLQMAIQEHFVGRVTVLVPAEAQMSVIKGAVLFGHRPDEIKSRVARLTYGCSYLTNFNENIHRESKKVIIQGVEKCTDLFEVFVTKGDEIEVGSKYTTHFTPVISDQLGMDFNFYCMDGKPNDPQYVTDFGVNPLGQGVSVDMPVTTGGKERRVELSITFGGTELQVDAKDKTSGKTANTTLRFLTG